VIVCQVKKGILEITTQAFPTRSKVHKLSSAHCVDASKDWGTPDYLRSVETVISPEGKRSETEGMATTDDAHMSGTAAPVTTGSTTTATSSVQHASSSSQRRSASREASAQPQPPPPQQSQSQPASPPLPARHVQATPGPRAAGFQNLLDKSLESTLKKVSWENFAACYPTIAAQAPATLKAVQKQMVERLGTLCRVSFRQP